MQHLSGKRDIIEGNATPRLMEKHDRDVPQPSVVPFDDDEDGSEDESPQQVSIATKQNSAMKR